VAVVVNFNGYEDTTSCVNSLLEAHYGALTVMVIDNGSRIDEASRVRDRFGDQVRAIRIEDNRGYGSGANVGIRWALDAGAKYVWVLNNDTLVPPEAVASLVRAGQTDTTIGLLSPQISAPLGPEAPAGVWFAGGEISLERGHTSHFTAALPAGNPPTDSEFLTGCALMVRREVIEEIGAFWESLFLYWEDADLVLRAQAAHWRTCVVPTAWIHHNVHGSTPGTTVAFYYFRNAILVARRHCSLRVVARALTSLVVRLARGWGSALLRRRSMPHAETRGLLAGAALALRWTLKRPAEFASGVGLLPAAEGSFDVSDAPRAAR
jgi:GT2 family glycosyltransferase